MGSTCHMCVHRPGNLGMISLWYVGVESANAVCLISKKHRWVLSFCVSVRLLTFKWMCMFERTWNSAVEKQKHSAVVTRKGNSNLVKDQGCIFHNLGKYLFGFQPRAKWWMNFKAEHVLSVRNVQCTGEGKKTGGWLFPCCFQIL